MARAPFRLLRKMKYRKGGAVLQGERASMRNDKPSRLAGRFGAGLVGLFCAGAALWPAIGAEAVPDFSNDSRIGWIAVPGGFKAPASGPGPVTNDPAHPLVVTLLPNYPPSGRIQGGQPTFPVADLNNPILQPWAREELRKRNERILSGGTGFSRQ